LLASGCATILEDASGADRDRPVLAARASVKAEAAVFWMLAA
jgi:hypothetical protein